MIGSIANQLLAARTQSTTTERPSLRSPGFNLELGYAVGSLLDSHLQGEGYQPAGRKIGFTNPATWEQFGIETPIWAHIYEQTIRYSDGEEKKVSVGELVQPRIETELVLQVNDRIGQVGTDPAELVHALAWVAIGFEIVQCHYPGWQFSAAEAVADFCLHSELLVGPRVTLEDQEQIDLAGRLETFQVELKRNGEMQARGSGGVVLGSPIRALGFLIEVLISQPEAVPLQPGEIVTTGTMTPILPIEAGESWSVEVAGLDLLGLSIEIV